MTKLVDQFINEGAKISYRELSERGGRIIAWYDGEHWFHHHETETKISSEPYPVWKARAHFPSDAEAA